MAKGRKTGGRVKIELDAAQLRTLEELSEQQCTYSEIASGLGISVATLDRRRKEDPSIDEIIKKGYEAGKRSIRRIQYEKAMKGNITMLIWLGKQWLGQTDKQDLQHSGAIILRFDREDKQL